MFQARLRLLSDTTHAWIRQGDTVIKLPPQALITLYCYYGHSPMPRERDRRGDGILWLWVELAKCLPWLRARITFSKQLSGPWYAWGSEMGASIWTPILDLEWESSCPHIWFLNMGFTYLIIMGLGDLMCTFPAHHPWSSSTCKHDFTTALMDGLIVIILINFCIHAVWIHLLLHQFMAMFYNEKTGHLEQCLLSLRVTVSGLKYVLKRWMC